MRNVRSVLAIAVALTALVLSSHSSTAAGERADDVARGREIERIQSHFDSVLTELAGADLAALGSDQRARRAKLLGTLRAYRDGGVFPHNYDFAAPTPYFVDRRTGTLCAVAHLLAADGRRDIVDRVAASNNNVWVAELRGDAEFESWLAASGLTLDEAARIQVPYMPGTSDGMAGLSNFPTASFATASALASSGALVTTLVNSTLNRRGNSRLGNLLGIAAGAVSLGAGAAGLSLEAPEAPRVLLAANAVLGAASIGFSARGMVRRHQTIAARRAAARATAVSVAPHVSPEGKPAVGISIQF